MSGARVAGGVLALYALVLAGLLITGVYYALTFDPGRCSSRGAVSSNEGTLLAVLAVLSLGAGRLLGYLRRSAHTGPAMIPQRINEQVTPAVMWSLAGFLLLMFVLLLYETAALAGVDGLQPISSYVRCAAAQSPGLTALATVTVGSLLGSWIWYPTR